MSTTAQPVTVGATRTQAALVATFTLVCLLLAAWAARPVPDPAARPDLASQAADLIDQRRIALGLGPLRSDPALTDLARDWARNMATTGDLAHRQRLGAAAWDSGARFADIGENVAVGTSLTGIMDAFVASRTHQENLDEPDWTSVGVGAYQDANGRVWVAVNFSDRTT